MRTLLLFLFGAACAFSQPFSFGVKAGVPLTDFFSSTEGPNPYTATTNRYIIGPTAELRLPFSLSVEFDALYRHFNYSNAGCVLNNGVCSGFFESTTSGDWEFPLMAKYRLHFPVARPFVAAGVAWDTLSGLSQSFTQLSGVPISSGGSSPSELHKNTVAGVVIGGGIDVHALFLHVSPEIRYTRWGSQHFVPSSPDGGLTSNQNQVEFLVGITF
jgi:hypothetical protein